MGVVNDRRQAFITLEAMGDNDRKHPVAFLLDTGFNGGISLPQIIIQALGLIENGCVSSRLADGSLVSSPLYQGSVLWENKPRPVNVVSTQGQPLLGMALVTGHRLTVDLVDGRSVTLESLI